MNKSIIKNLLIVFTIILTSCSYEPVFLKKDYGFELNTIDLLGEKDVNRIIDDRLKLIKKSKDNKKNSFDLKINSNKQKNIISKNSQGDPLKFEINILVDYKILENGQIILEREIEKNNIYNNKSDKFELSQNEKNITTNLSEKISDNIISSIINLNDN